MCVLKDQPVVIDTMKERLCKRHLKWRDLFVQVVCVLGFLIHLLLFF